MTAIHVALSQKRQKKGFSELHALFRTVIKSTYEIQLMVM